MIKIKDKDLIAGYIGSTEVTQIYLGSALVWEGSAPSVPTTIRYKSYEGQVEELKTGSTWYSHIVSNTYDGEYGIITFDSVQTTFYDLFTHPGNIIYIEIPAEITSIANYAFGSYSNDYYGGVRYCKMVALPSVAPSFGTSTLFEHSPYIDFEYPENSDYSSFYMGIYDSYEDSYKKGLISQGIQCPQAIRIGFATSAPTSTAGWDGDYIGVKNVQTDFENESNFIFFTRRITQIPQNAFYYYPGTVQEIPDCCETINISAFEGYKNGQSSVSLPKMRGVKYIGNYAFYQANIDGQILLPGVLEIGKYAFYYNGLTEIQLFGNNPTVESDSFNSNLNVRVLYPDNATPYAIRDMFPNFTLTPRDSNLISLIPSNNNSIVVVTGMEKLTVLWNGGDGDASDTLKLYYNNVLWADPLTGGTAHDQDFETSGVVQSHQYSVIRIEANCSNSINKIIGGNVLIAGGNYTGDLSNVEIIKANKFDNADFKWNYSAPITTFYYKTDDSLPITIDESKWTYPLSSNTYDRGWGEITFEGAITNSSPSGFTGCYNLIEIVAPVGLKAFGGASFYDVQSLETVWLPYTYNRFQNNTFRNATGLTFVNSENIESYSPTGGYGSYAFYQTAISSHTIPEGCHVVGNSTFNRCSNLQSLTIPSTMTALSGSSVCDGCASLSEITCNAVTAPTLGTNPFTGLPSVGTLNYPEGSDYSSWYNKLPEGWNPHPATYDILYTTTDNQPIVLTATGWTEGSIVSNVYEEGQGILSLSKNWVDAQGGTLPVRTFYNCTNLETIELPNGVFNAPSSSAMFFKCSNLKYADLTKLTKLTSGTNIFRDCTNLEWAKFPDSFTNLPQSTLQNCTSISDVYMYATRGGTFATPAGTYSSNCVIHVPVGATGYSSWTLPEGWSISYDL